MAASEDLRTQTIEESALFGDAPEGTIPGLVVIFSDGRPKSQAIRLDGTPIDLGRVPAENVFVIDDDRVSRRHTRVTLCPDGVRITDLDSRNGTFVDGKRITDEMMLKLPRVLRLGQTLLLFVADIRPYLRGGVQIQGESVIGPMLREARERVARAAAAGETLLLSGPSGSGKELAARAFHAAAARSGPFVAVNCAAIPGGLAERLLFGARKGAYSGATADAEGLLQVADKGTLFLDEVAELDMAVQPKLLRVLETREVLALGMAFPRKVDIKVVSATLKDLRAEVAAGRFREDLYFRLGRPEVRLPPLIERAEEIPWLAFCAAQRVESKLGVSALFLEACILRAWPGNVREFSGEVRHAARAALDAGRRVVEAKDLPPSAGLHLSSATGPIYASDVSREAMEAALRRERGNVSRAARTLGIHRNQVRRWLTRNNVDPRSFGGSEPGE